MAFNPEQEYIVVPEKIYVMQLHKFKEQFIVRPPYQRKRVWDNQKKQQLLDSLFRRYFIPSIVLREVKLQKNDTRREVIDGQQRISTMQEFYDNKVKLPESLKDIDSRLPGRLYRELDPDIQEYVDFNLQLSADIIKNIQDPEEDRHLKIASDIFWRLQEGEDLNNIERAHAQLTSLARNFLVKYSGDYDFDHMTYKGVEPNPNKHIFFTETYRRTNSRMQHMALMGRFLLIEISDGATDINNWHLDQLINSTRQTEDGIGNLSYEDKKEANALLKNMRLLREVFRDDPWLDKDGIGAWLFRYVYFTVSCYILLRSLVKCYVYSDEVRLCFREFAYRFFNRTKQVNAEDDFARRFVENRQQDSAAITERDRIIRHEFFKFALEEKKITFVELAKHKDFSDAQRIAIYLRDGGICKMCKDCGKPENECIAPWNDFHADHIIPYSKGGPTTAENGQVLCSAHNLAKGASYVG